MKRGILILFLFFSLLSCKGQDFIEWINTSDSCKNYGLLYNWYAATYSTGGASIAPEGWHVPTISEFETMLNYIDDFDVTEQAWLNAGGYIKEAGYEHWEAPNEGATNSSGFTARGAGLRSYSLGSPGEFIVLKYETAFWVTDNYMSNMNVVSDGAYIPTLTGAGGDATIGLSIRCVKDDSTDPGSMTDYDGNVYPTIKIGDQVWMAANLMVTHFNNGTIIPWHGANPVNYFTNLEWSLLETPGACAYGNDTTNVSCDFAWPEE